MIALEASTSRKYTSGIACINSPSRSRVPYANSFIFNVAVISFVIDTEPPVSHLGPRTQDSTDSFNVVCPFGDLQYDTGHIVHRQRLIEVLKQVCQHSGHRVRYQWSLLGPFAGHMLRSRNS